MREDLKKKKTRKLLKENKGYFLLPVLSAVSLILLILSPRNLYGWGFFILLLIRIFMLKKRSLLLCTLGILMVTLLITTTQIRNNYTHLSSKTDFLKITVDPTQFKIEENLLFGTGKAETEDHTIENIVFSYRIRLPEEKKKLLELKKPIIWSASVTLREPEKARNLHQFDYKDYLSYKNIHWIADIEYTYSMEPKGGILSKIVEMRMIFLQVLKNKMPEGKMLQYVQAMLFNQKGEIETAVMDSYRKIGVIHLFSISGMHIQFLLTSLKRMLRFAGITREQINPIMLLCIIFYGLLTGGGIGIFRAICMNSLLLISEIFHKKTEPKDAFAFTMLLTLWFNPYLLFSLSFQLSYALSGVLYMMAARLQYINARPLIREIVLAILMTFVSFPFFSYHYFEINWMSIFVNILFSYFFSSYIFPLLWTVSLLAVIPFSSGLLFLFHLPLQRILEVMELLSGKVAGFQGLLLVTGRRNLFYYLVVFLMIILFLLAFEKGKKLFPTIFLFIFSFSLFNFVSFLTPTGKVITLDVGQGDAILFITPFHQEAILIDTGGKALFGEREKEKGSSNLKHDKKLVSALKAEGIKRLDAVILSHQDFDHTGSLSYLANEIPIDHLYFSSGSEKKGALYSFLTEEKNQNIILHPILTSSKLSFGSLKFEVLWPNQPGNGENDDSIVLLSKIGGLVWLFTGDLEAEGEKSILQMYPNLTCDIIKIGHHGSKTSTTQPFLKQLNPSVAIISAGKGNMYGHPHQDVVESLTENRVRVFRTDQQGAIHFVYNGKQKEWRHVLQ